MKNDKKGAAKKSAKASRTTTRLAALKDNRGIDPKLTVVTSKLAPHEVPDLKLDLEEIEIFEIPDEILDIDVEQLIEDQISVALAELVVKASHADEESVARAHDNAVSKSYLARN